MKKQSILTELISPLEAEVFLSSFFDKKPFKPSEALEPFLTAEDLDRWLEFKDLRTAERLKLVKRGAFLEARDYLNDDGFASPQKVKSLIREGATLVLNDVLSLNPAVEAFGMKLQRAFKGLVQVNLYYSPRETQGFGSHFDVHDVWVVQCEGEKIWRLYKNREESPINHPLFQNLPQSYHEAQKGPVEEELTLKAGDQLYVPRGVYHDAGTAGGSSLHLTFGITRPIGLDVVSLLFEALIENPFFRRSLPLDFFDAWREEAGKNLTAFFSSDVFREKIKRRFYEEEPKILYAVDSSVRLEEVQGEVCLCSPTAYVPVPETYRESLCFVLDRRYLTEEDLKVLPGFAKPEEVEKFINDLKGMGVLMSVSERRAA